ncbi:hypothetical protein AcW1_007197 [Taiwanofungus camphoratus]|nr:hypothetical protein AcW2_007734 [Antrodia cinnamomea]KAI0952809.1 hypothetical protein AcW1_007197 [Antrodia cinnamomea]
MLLSAVYPDKFRKDIERRCRARGIDVALGEYVDQIPASCTTGLTTRSGRTFTTADLVVPIFGSRSDTAFVASLGTDVLADSGCVKIKPTFELMSHPGVFAVGDIIDWPEQKQAGKAPAPLAIAVPNLLSFLAGAPQTKVYQGSAEMVVIPIGKNGGAGYFDVLWGIVVGDCITRFLKAKHLFMSRARVERGL